MTDRGAVETVTVPFDARSLSFDAENRACWLDAPVTLWLQKVTKQPQVLSFLGVLCQLEGV